MIVSAVLVLTAVSFAMMDGTNSWLLGGSQSNTEDDGSSADKQQSSGKNRSGGVVPAVVSGGEGKKALGPPGKTT